MSRRVLASPPRLAETDIHDVLRNDRRRHVIRELRSRVGIVTLRGLAESIAEREAGESPAPRNVRDSVYNSLHQTHLPKLDDMGIIRYDRDRKTIELDDSARRVCLYMEVATPYGVTWAQYYRTLALLALVAVVLVEVGLVALGESGVLLLACGSLLIVALSTAYQLWSNRWIILGTLVD
ncbi:DUF7344 domain-containing protein [Halomarina pelagica]|uniref:DUF7344 domain-containing protein n=1 Tax=Halomarina pelagica TaxID=2961599 RepID=UPI0020C3A411|nr:hypothetical protein [Halomarina sp. BND7]